MPSLIQTLRSLRRSPGFTLAAVLTLGLGMAAAVTLYGALHTVLLSQPPFPHAERLFVVEPIQGTRGLGITDGVPVVEMAQALEGMPGVEALGRAVTYGQTTLETPEGRLHTGIYRVDAGFAQVLGWRPFLGSWFDPKAREGYVVSYRFWKKHLGGDPSWIGRPLALGTQAWPVVGISRPEFELPVPGGPTVDVMVPMIPEECPPRNFALVRLAPGMKPTTVAPRLNQVFQTANARAPQVHLRPLKDVLSDRMDHANLLVFGAAALMLVLAAASVAGLFLARAAERAWETSLRQALGAPRGAVFGHFFREGLVVALAASLLGFLASMGLSGLLREALPGGHQVFGLDRAWAHGGVVLVTFGMGTALAGILALIPTLHLRREAPGRGLAQGRAPRGQGVLVVSQVAVATLLLAATVLLGRSLFGLLHEDLGFRTQGVLRVGLEEANYKVMPDPNASSAEAVASLHRALQALRQRPGIRGAGLGDLSLGMEGRSQKEAPWSQAGEVASVTAGDGCLELLGVRLVAGRTFTSDDLLQDRRVCLLDATAARALFPEGAVGRTVPSLFLMRFQLNTRGFSRDFLPDQPLEVVGVVAPIRPQGHLATHAPALLWVPSHLGMMSDLFVASDLPPVQVKAAVAAVLREHVPTLAVGDVTPLESEHWKRLLAQRQTFGLVGAFGAMALLLACLGIGGLMWGSVIRRTREIGVRTALGATPGRILAWVLRQGLRRLALGLALGLGAALVFGRALTTLLYGLAPADPLSLGIALLILSGGGLIACLLPALRAARIAPAEALRSE